MTYVSGADDRVGVEYNCQAKAVFRKRSVRDPSRLPVRRGEDPF